MMELKGYKELQLIHQSANSHVYRGVHESDGRTVALKMPAQPLPSARKLSTLNREYEILRRCSLDAVPKPLEIIDLGPSMILALEYIDAPDLRDWLGDDSANLEDFFAIALQAVKILGEIHRQDLIHRDLSPGNILFNPSSRKVSLIDFGSALEFPRQARAVADPTHVEGSPPFMSPEQTGRLNRGLDYRTDFYSLGAIFYKLLTGRLPFDTSDYNEMVHCHIAIRPESPANLIDDIPLALSELVLKMMSKDASDRYQSSEGILADLDWCRELWEQGQTTESLVLGQLDINDRFLLPGRLYGRAKETEQLLMIYREAAGGRGSMTFVSGHSGVGKTSLVKELYKPLAESGGYITHGKFDQYRRHLPYSALMEAFNGFIRQILAESEESVEAWRDDILEAVGPNGRLLTEVMPELEVLIGEQPEVDELPVAEARTRFKNVFLSFLGLLGTPDRPLVVFLDDLQWIDGPSLALIEAMAGIIGEKRMMMIGAYRSNEVPESHPLAITLAELRKTEGSLKEIELQELAGDVLIEFLMDTLHLSAAELAPLNEVILQKTGGNPLFFRTMLDSLHADGHIVFDYVEKKWTWDQRAVSSVPYADNVVEMLQARIPLLSGGQANMLGLGACLGNIFELDHLAALAEVERTEAARTLQPAVSTGLIQPLDADFELLMTSTTRDLRGMSFRFAHDRIQQAAYTLVEEHRKAELHLQIGRLLQGEMEEHEGGRKLFAAVEHLNKGAELMETAERRQLAELNLRAGRKAKDSAAFADARACLVAARDLLEEDCWKNDHGFSLAVHLELAEASYLVSEFEQAEALYSVIREKAENNEDLLTLINIQAKQYHHQGRYPEAIALEMEGLRLLGIALPESDEELFALFTQEGEEIGGLLGDADIAGLEKRAEVDDPALNRTHEILFDLFADGYLMGRGALLACAAAISTRLSIEKGTCAMSSIGYINYGTCLCAGGQYEMGHGFGRVAVKLADRYQVAALKNYTYHLFALSINHWMEPLASSYGYWREASKLALESGSPYAGWVFLQLAHVLLASGAPLDRVEEQIKESRRFLVGAGMHDIAFMLELIVTQPVKHLRGMTNDITTLDDEHFNCRELMEKNRDALFFLSHIPYSMLRATLIGRDIQRLETMAEWMPLFEQTMQGQFIHVDCYFYFTLHLAAGCGDLPKEERKASLEAIDENMTRFKAWAELCPDNYQHKYQIIAAEKARLEGDTMSAIDLYDMAVDSAFEAGFIQDAALANELAGLFWLKAGKDRLALPYLEQALAAYARWGAKGKVAAMKQVHPELARKKQRASLAGFSLSASSATGDFSAQLDLMSIIKASQAVSRHMVLDKLAEELVGLAMQNAGATKAVLLLRQNGDFLAVKSGSVIAAEWADNPDINYDDDAETPEMVINYVIRSGESVVLDDAQEDERFRRCLYIASRALKSVCCIPIIKQKRVNGVLYLENSRMNDAFHTDRLKVLDVIASQAAISLENVNIYRELDDMNKNLESKVLLRTRELKDKNRELEILSTTDQLTGLYNRRYMDHTIRKEIDRSKRYGTPLSVALLDIDRFKSINDTHGHDIGDEVLEEIAAVLRANCRNSDVIGRWGGEEFLVVAPQTDAKVGSLFGEKLREAIRNQGHRLVGRVTASFGIAEFRASDTANSLVKRADQALYKAKEGGRDRVVCAK